MSARRFTDKASLDPSAVWELAPVHPAMIENRTLFPSTVVDVDDKFEGRLLISGKNSRKLGETIEKGRFKGYKLYSLTLEERATCPLTCDARAFCYGASMQYARRHRIIDLDLFHFNIEDELRELFLDPKIPGIMVRLHVLGDFPSTDYVAMWNTLLEDHKKLACFGYTHCLPERLGGVGTTGEIGNWIELLKKDFPTRFRIRWSAPTSLPDGAVITGEIPDKPRTKEGLVCPAQTDATACCASCGFCWETAKDTVVFIKHGRISASVAAEAAASDPAAMPSDDGTRPIAPLKLPAKPTPSPAAGSIPVLRLVAPTELRVEPRYQRDLSGKSITLIRKIVADFDWRKFKPPICAETPDGLFVIDGQHTAIAAASHPFIKQIPVMIVQANMIETRAGAFVAHNRDRITMSPFQILHAEAAAGGAEAVILLDIVKRAGAFIPRSMPQKGKARPGEIIAVEALRRITKGSAAQHLERIVRIAVMASCAPATTTVIRALQMIMTEAYFAETAKLGDAPIADALHSIKDFEFEAASHAGAALISRYRAGAILIAEAAAQRTECAA
jgi:hypothetical protein